jgi:hypothetical protein
VTIGEAEANDIFLRVAADFVPNARRTPYRSSADRHALVTPTTVGTTRASTMTNRAP